ncbi:hypothetical protein DF133_00010 [Burkholderia cenocepacia]|nr:hypothetical protein DF133_00010 [Burkholderia cenocepacia]
MRADTLPCSGSAARFVTGRAIAVDGGFTVWRSCTIGASRYAFVRCGRAPGHAPVRFAQRVSFA